MTRRSSARRSSKRLRKNEKPRLRSVLFTISSHPKNLKVRGLGAGQWATPRAGKDNYIVTHVPTGLKVVDNLSEGGAKELVLLYAEQVPPFGENASIGDLIEAPRSTIDLMISLRNRVIDIEEAAGRRN